MILRKEDSHDFKKMETERNNFSHLLAFVGWAEAAPLKVLASWSILEDVIRNVGKEQVEAHALASRGIDLHDVELTTGDQIRLREADLLVWLGLPLEPGYIPICSGLLMTNNCNWVSITAIVTGDKGRP